MLNIGEYIYSVLIGKTLKGYFSVTMIDTRVIQKRIKTSNHGEFEESVIKTVKHHIKSKNKKKHIRYYPIL